MAVCMDPRQVVAHPQSCWKVYHIRTERVFSILVSQEQRRGRASDLLHHAEAEQPQPLLQDLGRRLTQQQLAVAVLRGQHPGAGSPSSGGWLFIGGGGGPSRSRRLTVKIVNKKK